MNKSFSIYEIADLNRSSLTYRDNYEYINYVDTSNLTRNKIDSIQLLHRNFPSRAKRKVKADTILYSTVRPNQEHFGIVGNTNINNLIVSTGFTTIDVKSNEINPKYLYYKLTNPSVTNYLQTIAENSVSAYPSIKPEEIGNLRFKFPVVEIQQKIAAVLSALDDKIELNNQINAELEAMAKTLYDYWFVQFDFPNKDGKPYKSSGGKMVYHEVLKREIPEGWEVKKLSEIAQVNAGGDKPRVISESINDECKIPIFSNGTSHEGLYGFTNKAKIFEPSITISARGTIGYTVLRDKPYVPIIRLISVTPNMKNNEVFYFHTIRRLVFENSGSVQQQLTVPQVTELSVLKPDDHLLQKFHEITFPIYTKINLNKNQNQELAQLRDWLLPMLMNGQVTVGDREEIGMVAEESTKYKRQ